MSGSKKLNPLKLTRFYRTGQHPSKLLRRVLALMEKRLTYLEQKPIISDADFGDLLSAAQKLVPLVQHANALEAQALAIFKGLDHAKVYEAIKGALPRNLPEGETGLGGEES